MLLICASDVQVMDGDVRGLGDHDMPAVPVGLRLRRENGSVAPDFEPRLA
jgi:hypothetical protein